MTYAKNNVARYIGTRWTSEFYGERTPVAFFFLHLWRMRYLSPRNIMLIGSE